MKCSQQFFVALLFLATGIAAAPAPDGTGVSPTGSSNPQTTGDVSTGYNSTSQYDPADPMGSGPGTDTSADSSTGNSTIVDVDSQGAETAVGNTTLTKRNRGWRVKFYESDHCSGEKKDYDGPGDRHCKGLAGQRSSRKVYVEPGCRVRMWDADRCHGNRIDTIHEASSYRCRVPTLNNQARRIRSFDVVCD